MKRSMPVVFVVLLAMVVFSGVVFGETCGGLPGEKFFDVDQIIAPSGIPLSGEGIFEGKRRNCHVEFSISRSGPIARWDCKPDDAY